MKKNTMIRNLLYSICLHLLFLIFVIFNDNINNLVNSQITNINFLNVGKDFFLVNDIKTTEKDNYSNLSLNDKVDLYNLSKQNYDKNKKFSEIDYKKLNNKIESKNKNSNFNVNNGNKLDDKTGNKKNKNKVIYLGKNDYRKYQERKEMERRAEEAKKLESILTEISVSADETAKLDKEKELAKASKRAEEVDKKIIEILSKNSTIKKEEEKAVVEKDKEEKKNKDDENLNIDIDKIFTSDDVRQIRKYLQEESNSQALSVREKLNIQNQIVMCYKNAIIKTGKNSKVKVSVTLKLFYDGIIDTKEIKIKIIDDENRFNKEDYTDAIENVKVALAYCNPLRNLPTAKYKSWQNINFIFDATK